MCEGGKEWGRGSKEGGEIQQWVTTAQGKFEPEFWLPQDPSQGRKAVVPGGGYCHADKQYSLKKPLRICKETSDLLLSARACNPATRHPWTELFSSAGEATVLWHLCCDAITALWRRMCGKDRAGSVGHMHGYTHTSHTQQTTPPSLMYEYTHHPIVCIHTQSHTHFSCSLTVIYTRHSWHTHILYTQSHTHLPPVSTSH